MIPRWRFSTRTESSAEFASDPRKVHTTRLNREWLDQKLRDWRKVPTIGNAIELLSCGLGGQWLDEVEPAARYLQEQQELLSDQVVALASSVLGTSVSDPSPGRFNPGAATQEASKQVAQSRQRIRREPRNVLAWVDLARAYTILGLEDKALASIDIALKLAPTHRYVLRSAVRLLVHLHEVEKGHALLVRNPATVSDPWLISAELMVASIGGRNPRFVRRGRNLVESSGLPPEHLTEVYSALGTLDFFAGANRKARKNMRASLIRPTDNTVAQARWVGDSLCGIDIKEEAFNLPYGFEARCGRAMENEQWRQALEQCIAWIGDEPYSSRPATIGSNLGVSVLEEYELAETCARLGLQSDRKNSNLRNNLTVALAYQGRLKDAIEEYVKIATPLDSSLPKYVYLATGGLLKFRLGEIDTGRKLYERARTLAPSDRKIFVEIYRAGEEIFANTKESSTYAERVLTKGVNVDNKANTTEALLSMLTNQLKNSVNKGRVVEIADLSVLSALEERVSIDDTRLG